jgi:branched-subunit amino acid ABC-type transport system permease component
VNTSVLVPLLTTGIVLGSPLAVLGLGTWLVLNVARRFHFAYALTYSFAGMLAAVLASRNGVASWVALAAGVGAAAALGALIEIGIYRPLARRTGDEALLAIFVSGLGLTIDGTSALQFAWARQSVSVPFDLMDSVPLHLPGKLRLSSLDATTLVTFGVIAAIAVLVLRYTRAGQVVRGVRGNPTMARVVGIRPESVCVWLFALVSAAAGLAACFASAPAACGLFQ